MKETKIYKIKNNCSIGADIYYQGKDSPIIIYIHGGGLILGTRSWFSLEQIEYFLKFGFSIVNIDYRLAPETKIGAIIEDIRDAIEWVRTKAIEWYDFDISNIAVMGSSAGGYLSLLAGTFDNRLKAIVSLYGYGDILGEWYSKPSEIVCKEPIIDKSTANKFVGKREISEGEEARNAFYIYCCQQGVLLKEVTGLDLLNNKKEMIQYNPIDRITAEYPPTLFLHGDRDRDVPYEQSVKMYEKLKEKGVATKLITITGGDHVFDGNFSNQIVQNAFTDIINFLKAFMCK